MSTESEAKRLTDPQKQTVAENLGLAGMVVKRVLRRSVSPARAAEFYEELMQEGCLGLMQAVRTYEPGGAASFASYAVPRIHYAVWRALRRYQETIRLPERRGTRHDPGVRLLPPADLSRLSAGPDTDRYVDDRLDARTDGEVTTIGDLLREKVLAAVEAAIGRLFSATNSGPERTALARRLAADRLLVPEEAYQASLRQIAQASDCSYGRVAACEALLLDEIRRRLNADVEFRSLREACTHHAEGPQTAVDAELRRELRRCTTERFIHSFAGLPRARRAAVMLTALERAGVAVEALLRACAHRLTDEDCRELAIPHSADLKAG